MKVSIFVRIYVCLFCRIKISQTVGHMGASLVLLEIPMRGGGVQRLGFMMFGHNVTQSLNLK